MLIQAAQKNILLTYFVTECKLGKWTEGTLGELNESLEKVDEEKAIYLYFERMGLIDCRDNEFSFMSVSFRVNVEAHDFYNRGGFYGQEDLFQKNVEKLLLEVERLEIIDSSSKNKFSDIRKNIDKYLSILANLATIGDLGRDALG